MPLAYSSTLDHHAPTVRTRRLRGGALEPEFVRRPEKSQAKAHANGFATFQRKRRGLSLSGGASIPI
jgi:hypothetical protein